MKITRKLFHGYSTANSFKSVNIWWKRSSKYTVTCCVLQCVDVLGPQRHTSAYRTSVIDRRWIVECRDDDDDDARILRLYIKCAAADDWRRLLVMSACPAAAPGTLMSNCFTMIWHESVTDKDGCSQDEATRPPVGQIGMWSVVVPVSLRPYMSYGLLSLTSRPSDFPSGI